MRKKLCVLLAFAVALAMTNVSAASVAPDGLRGEQADRPAQSDTEFVVALAPEFAEEVISGQSELFVYEDEGAAVPSGQDKKKKLKKLPAGLLKEGPVGKEGHKRNLERCMEKHQDGGPVLLTVEVEDKDKMQEAREAVEQCEGVLYTDPLAYFYAYGFNDPRADSQWGLAAISAYDAWNGNANLPNVTIAILDTGVRMTHEDLAASITEEKWDYIADNSNPSDMNGHGTHVAGIAAAICDNNRGVASPAGGAKIMPVRVLDANGEGGLTGIANGIYFAANNGADIINLSLGSPTPTKTLTDAVEYAQSKGCLVVAAAGNDGASAVGYPARCNQVIIGATLAVSPEPSVPFAEASSSNYDINYAYRTIHAPGYLILSTNYSGNSTYSYMSGTSMASAQISGIAAAIKARGGYGGSLYDAVLGATYKMQRGKLNPGGNYVKATGTMNVLNYNAASLWDAVPHSCRIGQSLYGSFAEALDASASGDTITLAEDIRQLEAISVIGKEITFDLADHKLNLYCSQEGAGLYVQDGAVRISGSGEFNISCALVSRYGIHAVNSEVDATNIIVGTSSCAIRAEGESCVTACGNVVSGLAGVEIEPIGSSTVTIGGRVNVSEFAAMFGAPKSPQDYEAPSTKPGCWTYVEKRGSNTAVLWVKAPNAGYSKYDLNRDGRVDALDLGITLIYCGYSIDSPGWADFVRVNDSRGAGVSAEMCDVNSDGRIDMLDILDMFIHYTK